MDKKIIPCIGAAFGIAAGNSGCALGPLHFQERTSLIHEYSITLDWKNTITAQHNLSGLSALSEIERMSKELAEHTATLTKANTPFLVMGGDHSCAIGTWSGVASALQKETLGLIWIDAHMDSHTPETSDTKNIHGMPLATLLGKGAPELTHIVSSKPKIQPENICLIGIRSYEPAEKALLESMGVRVYYMENINQRGFNTVFQEALSLVSKNTTHIGFSIDLDGIDPDHAPGVGTPVDHGIYLDELLSSLDSMDKTIKQKLIGVEIAEFNPELDQSHKTEKAICDIIKQLF